MANTESATKINYVGQAAIERVIENTKDSLNTKVPINYGVDNAGRALLVGNDGNVTLGDLAPKIISVTQSQYDAIASSPEGVEKDAMYLIVRDDT